MRTRCGILLVFLAALLFPCSIDAAKPVATAASSAEKARAVLLAKGAERTAQQVLDAMAASLEKSDAAIEPGFWTTVRKKMQPRELVELLVPVYQRHLSNEDLDAMLQFYRSPAGKRLVEQEPEILLETMPVVQKWAEGVREQVLADLAAKGKKDTSSSGRHPEPDRAGAEAESTIRIRRLLEAMGNGRQAEQMVDAVLSAQRQSRPDIEPDFWPALRKRIRTEELFELSVPIYQRHLAGADLDELTRFFLSPAGRHLVENQPAIVTESMQAGQEWVNKLVEPLFEEIMTKKLEREEHSAEAGGDLRVAAERGDAKAQMSLGRAYEQGEHGVSKNVVEAVTWFRKAADQGFADAQYRLGSIYSRGEPGIAADSSMAATWYRKAAEQGQRQAMHAVAFSYLVGDGVPRDPAEAAKWLRKGAVAGDTSSMVLLGDLYENGEGLPKDSAEAVRLYRQAAEKHVPNAEYNLGMLLRQSANAADQAEGLKWLQAAADQGYARAKEALLDRNSANAGSSPAPSSDDANTAPPVYEVLLKSGTGTGFTGEAIELHLRNAGMRGVMGLLAQTTGLNVVLDARVHERVTGDFSGPWDAVLEKVLEKKGLTYRIHGNVLGAGPKDSPLVNTDVLKNSSDSDNPVSLTITAARLQDVIDTFVRLGVKFDHAAGVLPGSVTAYVAYVPLKSLLPLVLASTGYTCEEHEGVFTVRPLPEVAQFAAAAEATLGRCQTAACDEIGLLKLRATLTPQAKGSPTVSMFEFSEDRYQFLRAGEKLGEQARVLEAAPRKVVVGEKREGAEVPVTFLIEKAQ